MKHWDKKEGEKAYGRLSRRPHLDDIHVLLGSAQSRARAERFVFPPFERRYCFRFCTSDTCMVSHQLGVLFVFFSFVGFSQVHTEYLGTPKRLRFLSCRFTHTGSRAEKAFFYHGLAHCDVYYGNRAHGYPGSGSGWTCIDKRKSEWGRCLMANGLY